MLQNSEITVLINKASFDATTKKKYLEHLKEFDKKRKQVKPSTWDLVNYYGVKMELVNNSNHISREEKYSNLIKISRKAFKEFESLEAQGDPEARFEVLLYRLDTCLLKQHLIEIVKKKHFKNW